MLAKLRNEREEGFTLIELLVVILIIAILAAIAIPVFLRQREKGWRSQMESALKNAATAEESWLTVNSAYTTAVNPVAGANNDLTDEGLKVASAVNMFGAVATAGGTAYCLAATHDDLTGVTYWYYSGDGRPVSTTPQARVTEAGLTCPTP
jgi:type IV pilus assembly protein PilA